MSDLYGDLWLGESRSSVGNRNVCVYYLTRPATTRNAEDRLELGIIQTELDVLPPMLEFEFDPAGKFKLHGISPSKPPVVAVKLGDLRIEIPADCQLHQICDGEHFALEENLSKELFQQFVDTSKEFPPKLSQLSRFLDDLASHAPELPNPDWITFEFEACQPDGQSVKDTISAPSETEARATIEEMGYTITKLYVRKNAD